MPFAPATRRVRYVGLTLLVVTIATGYRIRGDYGVPWDELDQHGYGQATALYVFRGDRALFDNPLVDYGPAYEFALAVAEFFAGIRDTADLFPFRHFINFLTFVLGVVALYRLGSMLFRSRAPALAVAGALVLSPIIFGHAFFNSKDLPFLTFFSVAVYSLWRFLERPRFSTAALHAIATGWLIALRVPGVIIPAITVLGAVYLSRRAPERPRRVRAVVWLVPYLAMCAGLTLVFWPSLWPNPLSNFGHALQTMSRYPWPGEVLYAGRHVPGTSLPWHYVPVWIAITTPLIYLAGFVMGLPVVAGRAWRELRGPNSDDGVRTLILITWFFAPIVSVIALGSVLYDGWRHLYFVYPALLLIGMEGYLYVGRRLIERSRDRPAIRFAAVAAALLVAGNVAAIAAFMVRAHPYQHVYFNGLAGGPRGARFQFDTDYWGLSYRRGLEDIVRRDADAVIPVYGPDGPAAENALALPYRDRHRLVFVKSIGQAKYFVGAYRGRTEEYPYSDVVDRIAVDGAPVLLVAAINRNVSLTPETAPAVAPVRARNAEYLANLDSESVRRAITAGIRVWLSRFVRGAEQAAVEIEGTDLSEGRISKARVLLAGAEVGDVRRHRPGIPLRAFDFTAGDLIVDVAQPLASVRPAMMRRLTLSEFSLEEQAVNAALANAERTVRQLRIRFQDGAIRIEYLGRPAAEITLRPRIGPDPWKPGSDNLWLTVETIRVAGWRLPLAWLLQLALSPYSPAIDPEKVDAEVDLGAIQVRDGVFRMGTNVFTTADSSTLPAPIPTRPAPTQR